MLLQLTLKFTIWGPQAHYMADDFFIPNPPLIVETIEHFILDCTTYNSEREQFIELQQPYNENKDKVIGQFLFSKVNLEKKKEGLFQMWKKRERQLKTLRRQ